MTKKMKNYWMFLLFQMLIKGNLFMMNTQIKYKSCLSNFALIFVVAMNLYLTAMNKMYSRKMREMKNNPQIFIPHKLLFHNFKKPVFQHMTILNQDLREWFSKVKIILSLRFQLYQLMKLYCNPLFPTMILLLLNEFLHKKCINSSRDSLLPLIVIKQVIFK